MVSVLDDFVEELLVCQLTQLFAGRQLAGRVGRDQIVCCGIGKHQLTAGRSSW
jgi:hypothetical protein